MKHTDCTRRAFKALLTAALLPLCLTVPALAVEGDPLQVVNNLSDFVFQCIQAIGVILLGFGIVQIGLSLKGHDAGQRAQGFMCFFGGLLIAFAKPILDSIMG
ncbi:TrbC/VirB2 family protein [Intestinimonas butyriciproducens]|uniref:TrbC/VIRB2 family protein n=1 Tax=Intestinimonas butyriciproducens TaxID=1297617 RepID=A0A2U1CC27_9FIRM|nr:TrbC/VirB2 family protein [Intestinimonas butyriciproducens]MCI6362885.1 TrbC/VirB2 family protein [Intestinimonas butyriciproducens]MCR1906266.1 TrbC/VirB2 family protein [Intestinimonas butyriciproducens]PVY58420.1 hypothetical protein C7373_10413 [Intestinimonas butyriciproducens]QBB65437.1 VirB2-like protein [Intestinimonas butyriciproducens]